jgi:hypothetical protein
VDDLVKPFYITGVQISKKLKNVQVAQTFIYLFEAIVKRKKLVLSRLVKFVHLSRGRSNQIPHSMVRPDGLGSKESTKRDERFADALHFMALAKYPGL